MADQRLLVTASPDEARARIREVALAEGWRPKPPRADGMIGFERGAIGRTVLLGVLAGKGFHLTFWIAARPTAGGTEILYQPATAEGLMLGGIIGQHFADQRHERTVAALRNAFAQAGLLREAFWH